MSRTDDIINCAGHRLSTGSIEEILTQHKDVAECAVVGFNDELKGQVPIGLIVLSTSSINSEETIIKETINLVRKKLGPVASYKKSIIVENLPKTRSGKILRSTISKILNKDDLSTELTLNHTIRYWESQFKQIKPLKIKLNKLFENPQFSN